MKHKRQLGAVAGVSTLVSLGLVLVVYAIVTSYGADVVGDVRDDIGTDSCAARSDTFTLYNESADTCYNSSGSTSDVVHYGFNVSGDSLSGMANTSEKLPTISSVAVAAIIIGIIMTAFGGIAAVRMA